MTKEYKHRPSLENLIESEDLGLEILHPGALEITEELAELCHIGKDTKVLDVASGTGESACFLVENFICQVVGVDASDYMVQKAREKAKKRGLNIEFRKGDAHNLPFEDDYFDVVISECTISLLDKERAICEMARVTKSRGYVGIHDICWKEDAPENLKQKLEEIEDERPETLGGWRGLFEKTGLKDVMAVDKSYLIPGWGEEIKKKIGIKGELKVFLKVFRNWGISGYKSMRELEQIFQSPYTGYCIIVGRKT